jgi:hypothetical protein
VNARQEDFNPRRSLELLADAHCRNERSRVSGVLCKPGIL